MYASTLTRQLDGDEWNATALLDYVNKTGTAQMLQRAPLGVAVHADVGDLSEPHNVFSVLRVASRCWWDGSGAPVEERKTRGRRMASEAETPSG